MDDNQNFRFVWLFWKVYRFYLRKSRENNLKHYFGSILHHYVLWYFPLHWLLTAAIYQSFLSDLSSISFCLVLQMLGIWVRIYKKHCTWKSVARPFLPILLSNLGPNLSENCTFPGHSVLGGCWHIIRNFISDIEKSQSMSQIPQISF